MPTLSRSSDEAGAPAQERGPSFDGGLDRAQAGGVLDELQSGAHGVGGRASPARRTSNRAKALELASRCLVSGVAARPG